MLAEDKKNNILLIDDNSDDIFLTKLAIKKANIQSDICVVNNGEEAISFLNKSGRENLPDLILLDINLPKITGIEVLKRIKSSTFIKSTPIIVFTSSDSSSDMEDSYQYGADYFIRKPNNINDFKEIMEYIKESWF